MTATCIACNLNGAAANSALTLVWALLSLKHTTGTSQCRLEANYAYQQELDMIPLMMQENYKPQGWRESERPGLEMILSQSP